MYARVGAQDLETGMKNRCRRVAALAVLSSGMLLASTCSQIADTIGMAFNIVDIWV